MRVTDRDFVPSRQLFLASKILTIYQDLQRDVMAEYSLFLHDKDRFNGANPVFF
jgi:hypothetical protein